MMFLRRYFASISTKTVSKWMSAFVFGIVLGTSGWVGSVHADERSASEIVEAFHEVLLAGMQLKDHKDRVALFEPVVGEVFNLQRIAQISCGRAFGKLSDAEQQTFVEALHSNIAHTYAARFHTFRGQQFTLVEERAVQRGVLVRARLQGLEQEVMLDYFFRDQKVFNVAADGVSDLSLRRSEYSRLLRDEGFSALLEKLKSNTQKLSGEVGND